MVRSLIILMAGLVLPATGCDSHSEQVICPAVILPAVVVEVRDTDTGGYMADRTSGYIQERGYADPFVPHSVSASGVLRTLQAGMGRAGTYLVLLEADGYATWERDNVVVSTDVCGVVTERLTAEMQPL